MKLSLRFFQISSEFSFFLFCFVFYFFIHHFDKQQQQQWLWWEEKEKQQQQNYYWMNNNFGFLLNWKKNRREKTNTIHIYKLVNIFSKIKKNGRKINLNTCYIYLPQSFLFCFIAPSSKNLIENICVPIINHNRWQTVFFSGLMTDVPRICIRFVHSIYVVLYWYVYGINVCVYIPKFDTVSERKKRILFNLSES